MKTPQAWKLAASSKGKPVTARINMGAETVDEGKCPECGQVMERVNDGDHEVLCCLPDRIVIPIKD